MPPSNQPRVVRPALSSLSTTRVAPAAFDVLKRTKTPADAVTVERTFDAFAWMSKKPVPMPESSMFWLLIRLTPDSVVQSGTGVTVLFWNCSVP